MRKHFHHFPHSPVRRRILRRSRYTILGLGRVLEWEETCVNASEEKTYREKEKRTEEHTERGEFSALVWQIGK